MEVSTIDRKKFHYVYITCIHYIIFKVSIELSTADYHFISYILLRLESRKRPVVVRNRDNDRCGTKEIGFIHVLNL